MALKSKEALKDGSVEKLRSERIFDAVMENTYPITINRHGSGLDVYFKKDVIKHFKRDKTIGGTLVKLTILEEDIESRVTVIRNREQVLALVDRGHFDVGPNSHPILIIKPNQTGQDEG